MQTEIKVLLIDNDGSYPNYFIKVLEKSNRTKFVIDYVSDYISGLYEMRLMKHDIYFIDYYLGDKNGLQMLKEIDALSFEKPIIFLTLGTNHDIEAMNLGAADYITKKGLDQETVDRSIRYAIDRKRLCAKIKKEEDIKNLILDETPTGICLMDEIDGMVVSSNKAFSSMFGLERDLRRKDFYSLFSVYFFDKSMYDNSLSSDNGGKEHRFERCDNVDCPCSRYGPKEVRVKIQNGLHRDCLMQCKKIDVQNGEKKTLRLFSFVDITKQKKVEQRLLETQQELQDMIRQFGLEEDSTEAILSLVDLEMRKFNNIEEMCSYGDY